MHTNFFHELFHYDVGIFRSSFSQPVAIDTEGLWVKFAGHPVCGLQLQSINGLYTISKTEEI